MSLASDIAAGVTPAPVPIEAPSRVVWRRGDPVEELIAREWLVTNGLGGYASGTLGGVPTRRFHGLLVAALPAPLGRTMMLNYLVEELRCAGAPALSLVGLEAHPGPLALPEALAEVRLVNGRPHWLFQRDGLVLEKSIVVPHGRNTCHVVYRLIEAPGPVTLSLEPLLDVRPHEGQLAGRAGGYEARAGERSLALVPPGSDYPLLHLDARVGPQPAQFVGEPRQLELIYRLEQARGYDSQGPLYSVGRLELTLAPGQEVTLTASTEGPDEAATLPPGEARALDDERRLRLITQAAAPLRCGLGAELVLAADAFVITPSTRPGDEARLRAVGDDARTVIAGYHWFTDWGRDTMISLEGLTLVTGRHAEARDILLTFAHHIRDGLIPNLFPEGESEGLYHTADATLWFFHALDRYERASGDIETRRALLPRLVGIIEKHLGGTRFGIGVDPGDGLLRQGAPGYQLTWMDAKVGDWVVTPRRGKAVEINALFYNALCLLERWLREEEDLARREPPPVAPGEGQGGGGGARAELGLSAADVANLAANTRRSFNQRFWYAEGGYLYDVIDGEAAADQVGAAPPDASLRPNQLFAISLPHPVLDRGRWESVLHTVREELLTPFGLRSLARRHPDYKQKYDGDLRARDAAYHQGTVWNWLIGPFVDAWLKAFPGDREGARGFLAALGDGLGRAGVGSLSEICDAEPPYQARGCIAQAWSVAEALRVLNLVSDK